jgi:hypothetical protein
VKHKNSDSNMQRIVGYIHKGYQNQKVQSKKEKRNQLNYKITNEMKKLILKRNLK